MDGKQKRKGRKLWFLHSPYVPVGAGLRTQLLDADVKKHNPSHWLSVNGGAWVQYQCGQ